MIKVRKFDTFIYSGMQVEKEEGKIKQKKVYMNVLCCCAMCRSVIVC